MWYKIYPLITLRLHFFYFHPYVCIHWINVGISIKDDIMIRCIDFRNIVTLYNILMP